MDNLEKKLNSLQYNFGSDFSEGVMHAIQQQTANLPHLWTRLAVAASISLLVMGSWLWIQDGMITIDALLGITDLYELNDTSLLTEL